MGKKTPSLLSSLGLTKKPSSEKSETSAAKTGPSAACRQVEQRIALLRNLEKTQTSRELLSAARQGDVDRVNYLITSNSKFVSSCDVNYKSSASEDAVGKGATALHLAALHNHAAVVSALLTAGASVSAMTQSGMTALHLAAKRGSKEAVAVLLAAASADLVMEKDSLGNTALTYAHRAMKDSSATVQTFKRFGWFHQVR